MLGRICTFAALCAAAALAAFLQPEQADARSAGPLAAAHHCSQIRAASSHRIKSLRVLSSAQTSEVQHLCKEAQRHVGAIRFWMNPVRRWTLYLNQSGKKCWNLKLAGPESLCLRARASVREHAEELALLDAKIKAFLPPPAPQPHLVHDQLFNDFICIHGGEGAWNAVSAAYYYHGQWIRYYGGLQMDLLFQSRYGADFMKRWGTANNWPAWAQIEAAVRAYRSGRGFYPWPTTARACGLL